MQATATGGTPTLTLTDASLASVRPRLDSVDLLRGLVIVIMALDHARDFFTNVRFDPTDLTQTSAPLFLTRWITHFCAPVFVFLAGTSAYLYQARGKSLREVSRFLLTRGLWLILTELTLVRFAWTFNLAYDFAFLQVIWVIGFSMVVLAGLIYLPRWAIATSRRGWSGRRAASSGWPPRRSSGRARRSSSASRPTTRGGPRSSRRRPRAGSST